jgi:hypothetical protein
VFLVNSPQDPSPAALSPYTPLHFSKLAGFKLLGRPFSRSYGAILQSSLTGVNSPPFGASHLAHLCRFAVRAPTLLRLRRFSRQSGTSRLHPLQGSPSSLSFPGRRFSLSPHHLRTWTIYSLRWRAAPPASRLSLQVGGAGFLTGCPSATPFGLTLGPAFPYVD